MARASTGASPAAKTGRGSGAMLWCGGLGCGAMVVLSPASAVLLLSLIVPVLLVMLLPEDGPGGRVARAALLFGLAASLHPLRMLWDNDATLQSAITLIRQPLVLLTAWVAILAAWFTAEFSSIVLRLTADLGASTHRRALTVDLAALEAEWGTLLPLEEPKAG